MQPRDELRPTTLLHRIKEQYHASCWPRPRGHWCSVFGFSQKLGSTFPGNSGQSAVPIVIRLLRFAPIEPVGVEFDTITLSDLNDEKKYPSLSFVVIDLIQMLFQLTFFLLSQLSGCCAMSTMATVIDVGGDRAAAWTSVLITGASAPLHAATSVTA